MLAHSPNRMQLMVVQSVFCGATQVPFMVWTTAPTSSCCTLAQLMALSASGAQT